jgi:predicted enzyme related to lactoylglutathione lyase
VRKPDKRRRRRASAKIEAMTKLGLVLDCRDPEALAPFWAAALDYDVAGGAGAYVLLLPKAKAGPQLLLQRVPEAKSAKNRMHLDLHVADIDAEAARLEALGAKRVSSSALEEHGTRWHLLEDPEGNELCVCDAGAGGAAGPA